MAATMSAMRTVAVWMPLTAQRQRRVLTGIEQQARARHVAVQVVDHRADLLAAARCGTWIGAVVEVRPDGARGDVLLDIEALLAQQVRCVSCTSPKVAMALLPSVIIDPAATGRLAATWARRQRLRDAVVIVRNADVTHTRLEGLRSALGDRLQVLWWRQGGPSAAQLGASVLRDGRDAAGCGLIVETPMMAAQLIERCPALVRCPLLCLDDDPAIAEAHHPPLAAIDLGWERLGAQAVRMLLSPGTWPPVEDLLRLPPLAIRMRPSTRSIDDALLTRLLAAVRARAPRRCTAVDLVRLLQVHRRSLERHVQTALGMTPVALAAMVTAEAIRRTLAQGTPEAAVARSGGFASVAALRAWQRRWQGRLPVSLREK